MARPPIPPPTENHYRPGQHLFEEGQSPGSVFVLRKGTVSIQKRKGHAHIELGRIYANEVLGELSFFDRQPRSASAVALTEVIALEIKMEGMDLLYAALPEYFRTIVAGMAERLRKANETIKRLQKEVVQEPGAPVVEEGGISATEALALANAPTEPSGEEK